MAYGLCWAILAWALLAPRAYAQPTAAALTPATAVLLATAGGHPSAKALDSVIGAALDELKVVNVVARPGLDLGAVQLALDCVAETPQCLRMATAQHDADVLVAPTLARTSHELVLSLLRFDARTGKTQRVLRRQAGQQLSSETLDAVPGMLRELFGLPAKAPPASGPVAAADKRESASHAGEPVLPSQAALRGAEALPEPPMEPPGQGRPLPLGPLLLGGGGVALLGAGLVMGFTVLSAQNDYESLSQQALGQSSQDAMETINSAIARRATGRTNAVITNIFLGLGSAVIIASGIWLGVELSERAARYDDRVHVSPLLSPHEVGLVLTRHGAGL